jgi:PTH2 family peptidyl-tRNA hydrolase
VTETFKIIDDWIILGRPGYAGKKKKLRRKELQEKFGEGNWTFTHLVNDKLHSREEALELYETSYYQFFKNNPEILEWLVTYASDVYDTAPSNIESGFDYSIQETDAVHLHDIAIRRSLRKLEKKFQGEVLLEIRGEDSGGYILSPSQVPFHQPDLILKPHLKGWWGKNSIESFWQSNKVLLVKYDTLVKISQQMIGVVLRKDIHMGKGKFCVQTAHAIVSLISEKGIKWDFQSKPIEIWTVNSEEDLLGINRQIQKLKINCSLIRDAGKTQLDPGTKTAVGIGPINEAIFEKVMYSYDAKPQEIRKRSYRTLENLILYKL